MAHATVHDMVGGTESTHIVAKGVSMTRLDWELALAWEDTPSVAPEAWDIRGGRIGRLQG
jgi:hypothetical protein